MTEDAHAIACGRAQTAVVLLVGLQAGLSARLVRYERRGPDYHAQEASRARRESRDCGTHGVVTPTQSGGMLSGREDPSNPEIGHFGPFSP